MKLCGIYCIENIITGKNYIGQSVDIKRRWATHLRELEKNKHSNQHLQNAFNKYGRENFDFKVLLLCEQSELTRYEQFFVDSYTPELLYNMAIKCVDVPLFSLGRRIELSKNNSGENNPMYGKTHTKDARAKISKANTGRKMSDEFKENLSLHFRGEGGSKAILTESEVLEIRKLLKEGNLFQGEIAKLYGVNRRTINYINTRKTWKYLPDE